MSNIEKYFVDGKFFRTDLANDISRLKISKEELDEILSWNKIEDFYFESIALDKLEKSKWNAAYLQELTAKAVAECFTREYLLYLYDVACYVNNNKLNNQNKNKIIMPLILVIAFMIFILYQCTTANKNNNSYEKDSVNENKTVETVDLTESKEVSGRAKDGE